MPVSVPTPFAAKKTSRKLDIACLAAVAGVHIGHKEDIGMPCWYFDKHQLRDTPSIRNGIPFETERRYRREGARFIVNCGTQMELGHNTVATGVVYFHRFYMFHSFKNFPRYVTACCCLFLAGKVEETPKKCRDIIRKARELLPDNHFYSFGEDPKEEVMTLERILLQTIKFDLQVEHPYGFLLQYVKCFKGDQQKLQKILQMAWNFVNDSLSTVVCLQWEPEIIAVALIHLASKLSKFQVVDWKGRQSHHTRWWDKFVAEVTMEILEDICHQVLDLYQNNQKESNGPPSPPQLPPSRAELPKPTKPRPSGHSTSSTSSHSPVRKSSKQSYSSNIANNSSSTTSSASSTHLPSTHNTSTVGNAITTLHGSNSATNHIQPIRSLASSTSIPTAQVPQHHMYRAPPPSSAPAGSHIQPIQQIQQIHSIYTAPAPPPPPLPPLPHNYGQSSSSNSSHGQSSSSSSHFNANHPPPLPPYPPSMWPPSSHYSSNIQSMPPPAAAPSHSHMSQALHGGNSGNYYHHSQYHSRHQQHHSHHYGRQQRY